MGNIASDLWIMGILIDFNVGVITLKKAEKFVMKVTNVSSLALLFSIQYTFTYGQMEQISKKMFMIIKNIVHSERCICLM